MSQKNKEFKVKFWGIRGSYPIPAADKLKYGGNTACVEINVNGHQIILDAGTGIIELGNNLTKNYIASGSNDDNRDPVHTTILVSHTHHDHLQGLPFFKPVYLKTSKISILGPKNDDFDFKEILSRSMFSFYFPIDLEEVKEQLNIINFKETEVLLLYPNLSEPEIVTAKSIEDSEIDENVVVIRCLKCYAHPKDGVLIYKIQWKNKSVVYASDKESYAGGDSKLTSFARNTDLLIHDSQYTMNDYTSPIISKQGFGHSTPEMAIEAAKLCNAKKLILFHIEPSYNDDFIDKIEESAKNKFVNCQVAYEGLEIVL